MILYRCLLEYLYRATNPELGAEIAMAGLLLQDTPKTTVRTRHTAITNLFIFSLPLSELTPIIQGGGLLSKSGVGARPSFLIIQFSWGEFQRI
jgi:hypothetical protein